MPYQVVRTFEERVAAYAGAKFGVAVESGTAAIFLSILRRKHERGGISDVWVPKRTYPSVPCSVIHAGGRVRFKDEDWRGVYDIAPLGVVDAALRFSRGMYQAGTLYCLSFHAKKHLAIGRGGMILTDDEDAYRWLKKARFDGRDECDLHTPQVFTLGWNMYLTPDQAARGLMAFSIINNRPDSPPDLDASKQGYPDLSEQEVYRQ